ncbi:MAG: ATP-binding cassette domain-containing protein [Prochloraceae cyanobacterium]|nr:ATP-binding cassette domain-containing protein [Prochloraceae cyanobacterium]
MNDRLNKKNPILKLEGVVLETPLAAENILQDISFDLFRGDRLTIIGPTGAGKTSLLKLLNRLSNFSRGEIYFHSQSIKTTSPIELRQKIVLVPQEPKLLGMSVKEAIVYPLFLQQLPQREIQQRIITWTELLRIPEDWFDRNEVQLSLGQRQLVAIARGLVMQPEILLLDEPTSALDAGRTANLIKILIDLTANNKTSVIMVNHQLEAAIEFAERVLYLEQGRLLKDVLAKDLDWQELRKNLLAAETKLDREWS